MNSAMRSHFIGLSLIVGLIFFPIQASWGQGVYEGEDVSPLPNNPPPYPTNVGANAPGSLNPSPSPQPAASGVAAGSAADSAEASAAQQRAQRVRAGVQELMQPVTQCLPENQADIQRLTGAAESCSSAINRAAQMCLESFSPALQEVAPALSAIGSALSASQSMRDKCNRAAQGFNMIQGALAAYQGICGGTKVECSSSCSQLQRALKQVRSQIQAKLVTLTQPNQQTLKAQCDSAQAKLTSLLTASKEGVRGCEGYTRQLDGAGVGLILTIMSMNRSSECSKETSSQAGGNQEKQCKLNPNAPQCVDCNKPEYQEHQTCICLRNPRNSACQGGGVVANPSQPVQGPDQDVTDPNGNVVTPSPNLNTGSDPIGGGVARSNSSLGASGGGVPMGGPVAGGGDGIRDERGTQGTDNKSQNQPGSASILELGGGGSGGVSTYRSLASSSGTNPYSQFLPGGDRDPRKDMDGRGLASNGLNEISGRNGLSNFQKIRIRYQANRPSFMD